MAITLTAQDPPEAPPTPSIRLAHALSVPAFTLLQERIRAMTRLTDMAEQIRRLQETELIFARSFSQALQVDTHRQIQDMFSSLPRWDALERVRQEAVGFSASLQKALTPQIRPLHDLMLRLPPDPFERIRQDMTRIAQLMAPMVAQLQQVIRLAPDPATVERHTLLSVREAVEEGAADEALPWLLGRLGLLPDHVTALWHVLLAQGWSGASRPFAYVARATRFLYRRQASPQGRLSNGPLISLEASGVDRLLIKSSLIPQDPLAEVETSCAFEQACLLARLTPDAITIAKLRLRYGPTISDRDFPTALNWARPRVEAALRDLRRKRDQIKKYLWGA